ncbi:MAG: prepilin-type N-terminal cleavage/methylation domain-containing protein [Clostridium sp.]|uniref:prepilin-type N-terminal cleavage/methylation domain-containing protein n=1 Tax=Clostridium sp. TaxID=1506 RepID=UPI0030475C74
MKFKFKDRKKRGFTLIEVMVGIALFSIISMVLVSVMSFSLRMNYINKDTYDADSYSKAFFEAIKNNECKPKKPSAPPVVFSPRVYYKTFIDVDEVTKYAKDGFANIIDTSDATIVGKNPGNLVSSDTELTTAITNVKANPDNPDHTIGFMIKVMWDVDDEVYKLETWTWNIEKGETTLVNRKTLIAPRTP